ncbi:MAG: hypothetical protein ACI4MH_02740 [Candidatus Coproplasma sp.]
MKIIKNIFSKFYLYILWAMLALMFVGWIFTFITDTVPKYKVTVYADVAQVDEIELRVELEKHKPDDIRMVQVHAFSYVAFSSTSIADGDIYLIKQSDIEDYIASFCPLSAELCDRYSERGIYYNEEGVAYGIKVYDKTSSTGCATGYIDYSPAADAEAEDYYLFFNKDSLHGGALTEVESDAAITIADALLAL